MTGAVSRNSPIRLLSEETESNNKHYQIVEKTEKEFVKTGFLVGSKSIESDTVHNAIFHSCSWVRHFSSSSIYVLIFIYFLFLLHPLHRISPVVP